MDSVRAIVIGDLHFRRNDVEATRLMCEDILKICRETKVDFIVCLGDIMHEHETVRLEPWHRAIGFLKELGDIAPLYVLIGNHDIENNEINLQKIEKNKRKHAFIDLMISNSGEPIVVVDEVSVKNIKGQNFCFSPFLPAGQYMSTLEELNIDIYDFSCFFLPPRLDW